jgi:hypothetical protein
MECECRASRDSLEGRVCSAHSALRRFSPRARCCCPLRLGARPAPSRQRRARGRCGWVCNFGRPLSPTTYHRTAIHELPQTELFAKGSTSRSFLVLKSGLPIRRVEKITPRMGFLCCSGAYCDFRKAGKGPEHGRFATNQRIIL